MIDTHCHLNFPEYEKDIEEVIKRSVDAGVTKIIMPGADVDTSKKAVNVAQKYKECYAAVGIHPHNINEFCRDVPWHVSTLKELAQQRKVVATGEAGLDYYQHKDFPPRTDETKQKQKELFSAQIKIAQELDLPLIVHCREAWEDIFAMIYIIIAKGQKLRGVFHCYAGGKKWLTKALDLGFYLGVDGNVTYDEGLQNVVKEIPLDRLLLETDSPYLSPEPFRGQRNEPKNIKLIAEKIAELKNLFFEDLIKQIEINSSKLFELK